MQGEYNGMPLFHVGEDDFFYVMECICADGGKRLLSKNIVNDELRDYYVAARKPKFAIMFNEAVICWKK